LNAGRECNVNGAPPLTFPKNNLMINPGPGDVHPDRWTRRATAWRRLAAAGGLLAMGATLITATEAARTPDGIRPVSVTVLETPFVHSVHTYFGVSPWNRAGTRLLYLGFDDPGAEAHVVVKDLANGRDTTVAKTRKFNFHNAGAQHWALNDTAVVFSTLGEDGRSYPAVVSVDAPHHVRILKSLPNRTVRHVETDTMHALVYWALGHPDAAIERVNLQTEKVQTLVTVKQALAELPADLRDRKAAEHFFTHPVSNRSGTRMFFKLMKTYSDGTYRFGAFYTLDLRTGKIRCLGNAISGHPFWLDDDRRILNIESTRDNTDRRWLVAVDADTGSVERLFERRIEGPGHPSQSPDGRWIVTDAFTRDGSQSIIYLGDLKSGELREIARLDHRFGGGLGIGHLITRGQPHPAWSPDGREIIINCNNSGQHMQLLRLRDFVPAGGRAASR
jgi:hypothetical protein